MRDSKDFLRLLRDDTPEGIAKMLVFCIEIAVQHKVASGIAGTPQLVQVKSMLKECVKEATKEQGAAIAARARGIKLETPHADMFKGAHDAAKLATVAEVTAFEVAKQGGKHAGFYDQYIKKSSDEIHRGIQSISKQIVDHQNKIKNPEKSIPNFRELDYREQEALINKKWPSDIKRQVEQKEILEEILRSRNG